MVRLVDDDDEDDEDSDYSDSLKVGLAIGLESSLTLTHILTRNYD